MAKEKPLTLIPKNNYFQLVIFLILSLIGFIFYFIISIISTSWLLIFLSLFFVRVVLTLIAGFFKKTYLFYHDRIIVEVRKNRYLSEIKIEDIVSWNEYLFYNKLGSQHYLIIKSINAKLIIQKSVYENFEAIVDYFNKSGIPVDKSLKANAVLAGKHLAPLGKAMYLYIFLSLTILFAFWSIVRKKSDSDEKIFFTGKITDIHFSRRNVNLKVCGFPNLVFVTCDKRFLWRHITGMGKVS